MPVSFDEREYRKMSSTWYCCAQLRSAPVILLTRNKRPHGMLLPVHKFARLQLIMYPLIDLVARTVVGRNDECTGGRLGILPRNGRDTFIVSPYLMHTALLVKTLDGGSHLAACQLLNDLLQLWIALANDVIQRRRPHPGFL